MLAPVLTAPPPPTPPPQHPPPLEKAVHTLITVIPRWTALTPPTGASLRPQLQTGCPVLTGDTASERAARILHLQQKRGRAGHVTSTLNARCCFNCINSRPRGNCLIFFPSDSSRTLTLTPRCHKPHSVSPISLPLCRSATPSPLSLSFCCFCSSSPFFHFLFLIALQL